MIFRSMMLKGLVSVVFVFSSVLYCLPVLAQNTRVVRGVVLDAQDIPVSDATVRTQRGGLSTKTDQDGRFSLSVPSGNQILVISHIGKVTREISIDGQDNISITLEELVSEMDNVVVVGYGQQKKASVVGSIAQTSGKVLERTGGVTNLGMALTGNLPGVITSSSSGMPGAEDPMIIIRAQTTWNNSSPLVLVDGIERSMSSIDISSVESISVLKDASATAVYGVRGANGVILITTKRGAAGKALIQVRSNVTAKVASKLPEKYDAYDALSIKNQVIERELITAPGGWSAIRPQSILNKYRFPANDEEWDRFPNVDWEKELFRDRATSYNTSVNVSGGSQFVTYFAGIDYAYEGDLFKTFENNRGYQSGYGYTRLNVRSNLDFNLTKTTKFSTRLFGSNGVRQLPWNAADGDQGYWISAYRSAPDAMRPIYSDGTWGFYSPRMADVPNSVYNLAVSGLEKRTNTQLTTDFILEQQLAMITKGLSFRGSYSLDNTFREIQRGINDLFNGPQRKWINPENGIEVLETQINTGTQLDYSDMVRWTNQAGIVDRAATYRRQNYMLQLNYARKFGKHDVMALGLFQREKIATGSEFPHYREDWVFRATYNYDTRYFLETNGAYNGSEKFGPDFRFAFFPSFSAGWVLTNEKFLSQVTFLNQLKIRASWGMVGSDHVNGRWLYRDQWSYGGNAIMGNPVVSTTPYTFYRLSALGNPNISWETVEKRNLGVDYGFLNGKISGSVDIFRDVRTGVIIPGGQRAIPTYFGATAPMANLGEVSGRGYEIELRLNHTFRNGIRAWANTNMTQAINRVEFRDDPELLPAYRKQSGHYLGQSRAYINQGFIGSWDDIYGSTQRTTNNLNKLPGDYNIVDFNGDGVIDQNDLVPYGYSSSPQNTYNATLGAEWKGFSVFLQFYGVNNVTRFVDFPTFNTYSGSNVAYVEGTYWTKETGGDLPLPRVATLNAFGGDGIRYFFDGSFLRLKNAEFGYNLPVNLIRHIGIKSCKIYLNGNNLFLWTKMPDDRESNFAASASGGAYPTVRRYNLGIDITL